MFLQVGCAFISSLVLVRVWELPRLAPGWGPAPRPSGRRRSGHGRTGPGGGGGSGAGSLSWLGNGDPAQSQAVPLPGAPQPHAFCVAAEITPALLPDGIRVPPGRVKPGLSPAEPAPSRQRRAAPLTAHGPSSVPAPCRGDIGPGLFPQRQRDHRCLSWGCSRAALLCGFGRFHVCSFAQLWRVP